jgi:uncharacterized protein with ParB-like and HNH nuclease domain
MKNKTTSLRSIVKYLNNGDEDGGFWLPNIQRAFVWKEEQICKLFDSILREYPISSLLVWKTISPISTRKFIDNYKIKYENELSDFIIPTNEKKKNLVLDGQQRLQSLYIGLIGSYEGKELYFDITSNHNDNMEEIRYRFSFLDADSATFPWVKFKKIVYGSKIWSKTYEVVVKEFKDDWNPEYKEIANNNISNILQIFTSDEGISYQEIDSTENDDLYTDNDIVEIFIRANSGGTLLGKSDLLFALLSANWDRAINAIEDLLDDLNRNGFNFTRDFVLKTCLTLLDKYARYDVDKFRDQSVLKGIEENWDRISDSIKAVCDYLRNRTFIKTDKALPSYLILIPIIYGVYKYKVDVNKVPKLNEYLIRVSLVGAYGSRPDQLIDASVKVIQNKEDIVVEELYEVIRQQQRPLEITGEKLMQIGYGSKNIHLLFNLWYESSEYTPSYHNNLPQTDHIFPRSLLEKVKILNPETNRKIMKYTESQRNQLANCMLLTRKENGASEKWDKTPEEWFKDKNSDYLGLHLIPQDPSLWKLENYDRFIEERKKLILEKFKYLITRDKTI